MNTLLALPEHLPGVLALQNLYHKSQVGESGRGFLTFQCDLTQLETLNAGLGIIVSLDQGLVVAYNILMTADRARSEPVYSGLMTAYDRIRPGFDQSKVAVSAQYCVKEGHRGGRIIRSMFALQRQTLAEKGYSVSIGEVDSRNTISLASVKRILGYTEIGSYDTDNAKWVIVARSESA